MVKIIYRLSDGEVINFIELEDGADWAPVLGTAILDHQVGIERGDIWNGSTFTRPPVRPPTEDEEQKSRLQVLRDQALWDATEERETIDLMLEQMGFHARTT